MKYGLVLTLAAVVLCGCAHKKHGRVARLPPPITARVGDTEEGLASWYGYPYHGRPAANGEIYDMEKFTAAHRTLPFETWVRVRNLTNEKTVDVRITDRGPFIDGRIIDLSHAAARAVDMIGPGVVRVRIEVIRAPQTATASAGRFAVQVGVFRDRNSAEQLRAGMANRYGCAAVVPRPGNPEMWRVLVGSEPTEEGAKVLSDLISRQTGERSAFVVRLDS